MNSSLTRGRMLVTIVSVLFFLSGATALTAEVVLNKLLTYVFGSSHLATSTVLAAYMAGLSAGAWLFGRRAHELERPLFTYAMLELAVGIFYALLPILFGPFQRLGILLTSSFADNPIALTVTRFSLSFALVFAPTVMMGGTLPILVSAFRRGQALERSLPLLYSVNTLGAAIGTLCTSYLIIPRIGLDGTLQVCAALNVAIAISSGYFGRTTAAADHEHDELVESVSVEPKRGAWFLKPRLALFLAFSQGMLAFVLEVVWFHLIGTVLGVTTYAFALMLFAILLGIGLGSLALPKIAQRTRLPAASIFIWSMVLAAFGVAVSLGAWDDFSTIIDKTPSLRQADHFFEREGLRLAYSLAMLLPTTFALGMSLPALAAAVRTDDGRHGAWVGRLFAANTLGTITGSLGCGFVLLGRLGADRILQLGAVLAISLGAIAVISARRNNADLSILQQRIYFVATLACMALVGAFDGWDTYRLTLGSHYYWSPPEPPRQSTVEWIREDAQSGFITVMRAPDGTRTMRTNGKYEGSSEPAEFQDLFALLGGLYVKHHNRAVIVGMGPARTLSVLHAMPFKKIEVIEYSPAIIAAAKEQFPEFSKAAFDDTDRVSIWCDDGRNHLQLSKNKYDYIAVAISGAAFAGVGNIYSRDFFRSVSGKLESDGIFMLWIQVHHVYPRDVRSVVHTLRSVFPHVHLYTDPSQSQGFLFASWQPLTIDPFVVKSLDDSPRVTEVLAQHRMTSTLDLVERSVLTTEDDFARYLSAEEVGAPPVLLTDLFPAFEYSTPYALADGLLRFDFQRFSEKRLPQFIPALSEEVEAALQARRALAWDDKAGALEALLRAKRAGETDLYDDQIKSLELQIGRENVRRGR